MTEVGVNITLLTNNPSDFAADIESEFNLMKDSQVRRQPPSQFWNNIEFEVCLLASIQGESIGAFRYWDLEEVYVFPVNPQ